LQSPTAADKAIKNTTSYTIQFFYRSSADASNGQVGTSPNGTANPGTYQSITLNNTSGNWVKVTQSATSGSSTVDPRYGIGVIRFSAASGTDIDIDDFVMYEGGVDNTPPNSPGTVTVSNATQSSLDVSWGAASGGVDGGGYVVVRYSTEPNADNDPNQNGIYAVGNTITNGTGNLVGTVRYIGTGTSFTDHVGLDAGTQYWYKVYTVDKAFNYSDESQGTGTTLADLYSVTFYVDMTNAGSFTNVDIAGSFNNWGDPVVNMTFVENNIYTYISDAIFDEDDEIEFKFRKDGNWGTAEPNPNRTYKIVDGANVYHAVYGVMVPAKITWANLQYPPDGEIGLGEAFDVFGRVYAEGLTGTQGDAPNLNAWVGYSTDNTNPNTWTNWVQAGFNADYGNNEEYKADIGAAIAETGVYYYATRFRLGLADYVYGGYSESKGGGFWDGTTYASGELTVNAAEPSNHVSGFSATANSSSAITIAWNHNDGAVAATNYLILAKKGAGTFAAVADGSFVADDSDWSDNNAAINIERIGTVSQTYQWTGLTPSTNYDFIIYPYNGLGTNVNYKTDGTVPQDDATTLDPPASADFTIDFDDAGKWTQGSGLLTSYQSDHQYNDNGWLFTGGPALRNGNAPQDEVVGALGTYSWRLQHNTPVSWTATYIEELPSGDYFSSFGFDARRWSSTSPNFTVEYSLNGGADWLTATSIGDNGVINNSGFDNSSEWKTFRQEISSQTALPANQFIVRISGNSSERIMVDNFTFEISSAANSIFSGDGEWSNSGNWNNEPGSYTNVTISGNATLNGNVTTNNLNVGSGYSLTISPSGKLTVNGALTLEDNGGKSQGELIIKSDVSGTGSLIHNTDNVPATVERFIAEAETWRLLSSPVTKQSISGAWTPAGTYEDDTGYDFYAWSEPHATWVNFKNTTVSPTFTFVNGNSNFTPGRGYLVSYQLADQTKEFVESLNNGNVVIPVVKTGTDDFAGSNLIGNPYPSGIDWSEADRSLFADDFAYIYDRTTNLEGVTEGYKPVDGSEENAFIAAHQGFFVIKKDAGTSNFTFTNAMRAHGGEFTKDKSTDNQLVLTISDGNFFDKTIVRLRDNSTFNRDRSDAIKLFSYNNKMPQLYSMSGDDQMLAINSIPAVDESLVIPIGLVVPTNGEMTITLKELSGEFEIFSCCCSTRRQASHISSSTIRMAIPSTPPPTTPTASS
jgi:hypothetical protein